jgi:site-specific recombinase XerD
VLQSVKEEFIIESMIAEQNALVEAVTVPVEQDPALVYLASLDSPNSRRVMRDALNAVTRILYNGLLADLRDVEWASFRYSHVAAMRSLLAERYKPATVNKILSGVKGVLREAWRLGLLPAEDWQRIKDVPGIKHRPLPAGRALARGELVNLFAVCREDRREATGARDAALMACLYGAGLRRAEAAAVRLDDYNVETGTLTVRQGKGRKDRLVYLTNGSREAVDDWLRIRGADPGPLLLAVNKSGKVDGSMRAMTGQAIFDIVQRLGKGAGVSTFGPHDLRRSCITDLLSLGADLHQVAQLAGHESVLTTQRYDRRGEDAKQQAAALLHVPYQRRG